MEKAFYYAEKCLLYVLAGLVAFVGAMLVITGPTALHIMGGAVVFALSVLIPGMNEDSVDK